MVLVVVQSLCWQREALKESPHRIEKSESSLPRGGVGMPNIADYLSVRAATSPAFSPYDRRWYFLMNLTDSPQIYALNSPGAWPEMVTDYPERVTGVYPHPHGPGLLFTRDAGGSEYHQFYWLNLETRGVTQLTDNPRAMHEFGDYAPDGKSLAYTGTARNGRDYDLYIMSLETLGETRLVRELSGQWLVLGWDAEGITLKNGRAYGVDERLYRYRPEADLLEPLTPDEPAVYDSPVRGHDGSLYVLCDHGRDFLGVARLGPEGTPDYVVAEDADVDLLAGDKAGRFMAYVVNREGYSELHVRNLADSRDRHIDAFDQTVIFTVAFAPDGDSLAVTHAGPDHNMNISVVSVADGSVCQWTYAPMPGLAKKRFCRPDTVRFPSFDGLMVPAFVYRPSGPGPFPVVLSVHGGPEAQERPWFSFWYQYLVEHGYAVVTPNVRGSTGYGKAYSHLDDREKRMDSVRDLQSVVDWIRTQPDLASDRIAIYGGSYGGFMVLSGITQFPGLFRAAVDIVGIANLESFLENTSEYRRALREVEYGYLATDREFLRAFSPIHAVDRIQAPLYVAHGANDPRVPLNEAEQIVAGLKARNHPVTFRVFPDEGHGVAKIKNRLVLYPEIVAFLDEHMKD